MLSLTDIDQKTVVTRQVVFLLFFLGSSSATVFLPRKTSEMFRRS